MTDHYYAGEDGALHEESQNPYGPDPDAKDYEDWNAPTYRSTDRGILGTYKKQIGLSAQDVMEKDYWDNMLNIQKDMQRNFGAANRETLTSTLLTRMRLGRALDTQMTPAGDEYGDYKKFESDKNSVTEENERGEWDPGYDKFEKNARSLLR